MSDPRWMVYNLTPGVEVQHPLAWVRMSLKTMKALTTVPLAAALRFLGIGRVKLCMMIGTASRPTELASSRTTLRASQMAAEASLCTQSQRNMRTVATMADMDKKCQKGRQSMPGPLEAS